MRKIFVGSIYPPGKISYYTDLNSRIDYAGHTFQTALLKGLDSVYEDLKIITIPSVSSYPVVKKTYFRQEKFSHNQSGQKRDIQLGCINIPIIKMIYRAIDIYKTLKEDVREGPCQILMYAIDSPTLIAVRLVKKTNVRVCLLVPDLPQFMSGSRNILYRAAKAIEKSFIKWGLKSVDSYILLSKYMCEKLPVAEKPWLLMEGIYIDEGGTEDIVKDKNIVFLFTGTLGYRTGIIELAKAFMMLKGDNYELWVRGNGVAQMDIVKMSEIDPRIKYIPPLSKEKLIELQKKATFLINPVPPSQEYTKYFFPSKTMEYLASGTPTIMYNLMCLPEEYKEHLYFFDGESIEDIRDSLYRYSKLSRNELLEKGKIASKFIKEKKNALVQAQRIKDFLNIE